MFQVGLAKLLAKTVEVKGIDSAWLCCAQKPTRIVRRGCKGERPCRPPGVKGGRKAAPAEGGRKANASV